MDNRNQRRQLCQFQTYYQMGEGRFDRVWWWCSVSDASEEGVSLVTTRPLERGTALTIDLSTPSPKSSSVLRVHVTHATPQEGGGFHIGCKFDDLHEVDRKALRAAVSSR